MENFKKIITRNISHETIANITKFFKQCETQNDWM